MGQDVFYHEANGKTPQEAFDRAREEAFHHYGRGGYTGTIAEKTSFIVLELPPGISLPDYVNKLIEENDKRIEDKWGPAGAIKIDDGYWLFFGWASA
jgi:hypothetical protein